MPRSCAPLLLAGVLLALATAAAAASPVHRSAALATDFIRKSCRGTQYPAVCEQSPYRTPEARGAARPGARGSWHAAPRSAAATGTRGRAPCATPREPGAALPTALEFPRQWKKAPAAQASCSQSQPYAVDVIYCEVWAGRLALPMADGRDLHARGLLGVELRHDDVPSFVAKSGWCPVFLEALVRQFVGLEDSDDWTTCSSTRCTTSSPRAASQLQAASIGVQAWSPCKRRPASGGRGQRPARKRRPAVATTGQKIGRKKATVEEI
ncbi:hypothetical protein ACP70R_028194 [Stipagrostis hirtigluma subsp. patula]